MNLGTRAKRMQEPAANSANPADVALMNLVSQRDELAFQKLIERYGDSLAQTIGRLMAWSHECDDILQDVLISVWNKSESFDGVGSLEGWLKRIAINRCRNHFRATTAVHRKLQQFAEWLGGQQETTTTNASSDLLETGLARLSHDDRIVLVLFYLEEMKGSEVARLLDTTVEAMHVRLHRARTRLKKLVKSERE